MIWTEAQQRGVTLSQVASWMAEGPARIAGVPDKGQLARGNDADLVIFDPEATWTVDAGSLHHRNYPYDSASSPAKWSRPGYGSR